MRRHVVSVVATLVVVTAWFVATLVSDQRPLLGLDLQGGVSVVLFPVEGSDTSGLDVAVDIIRNRVDALGVVEPEVTRQGDTIVIDLPGTEDRQEALDLVGQTAQLRFRPVCGIVGPEDPESEPESPLGFISTPIPQCLPEDLSADVAEGAGGQPPATDDGEAAPRNAGTVELEPIAAVRPQQEAPTTSGAPPSTAAGTDTTATTSVSDTTTTTGGTTATTLADGPVPGSGVPTTPRADDTEDALVVLPGRPEDTPEGEEPIRYVLGPAVLSGDAIEGADAQFLNGWLVQVEFEGDSFVNNVATPLVGQQVAIVLDGVVVSAPTIQTGITGSSVVIEGGGTAGFSQGEADDLALVLRYGSLPVQFDPAEQTVRSVSPTLGSDQLRAGIIAGIVGLVLVALYMVAFYRLLGLVVIVGLLLTGMIFFSLVSLLSDTAGLTLTLAGVTGLIVSVGVTVDSYVVYFERLKDEVRSGRTIRSSSETGFRKSFRTIVAADLVSLMGAVILWLLAEGSVRGFAFFLGLSTIIDLVISYFFMHPVVALMADNPKLVRMRGVGIASGLDVAGAEL